MCCTATPYIVVPLRNSLARRHSKEQPANWIDIVIFKVDALQPRIVPTQSFRLDECFHQPFLRNPVDPANERLMVICNRFENESPVFQDPVSFRVAVAQVLLRQTMKFPLHVQCSDGLAVLKMNNPLLSWIPRYVAGALHGICQNQISR